MENRSFYLGIDGGGSKTTAVVFDISGHFIAGVVGESINFYSVGMDTARENMQKIISALSVSMNGSMFDTAVIGMSALNCRADKELTDSFAGGIIRADKIIMDSDLYVALRTLCAEGECAVVIAGTGSMVACRDKSGELTCAGGWGHILGDEGSGYRIGLEGVKRAIRMFDSGKESALTAQCVNYFNIKAMPELIDLFYRDGVSRKRLAKFAVNICSLAENGDADSIGIIKLQAHELFETAMCRIAKLGKASPIGLWGGIFQHSKLFSDEFCTLLAAEGFINAKLLPVSPEIGAILACFDENGIVPASLNACSPDAYILL